MERHWRRIMSLIGLAPYSVATRGRSLRVPIAQSNDALTMTQTPGIEAEALRIERRVEIG
jgi:hypothetical protein